MLREDLAPPFRPADFFAVDLRLVFFAADLRPAGLRAVFLLPADFLAEDLRAADLPRLEDFLPLVFRLDALAEDLARGGVGDFLLGLEVRAAEEEGFDGLLAFFPTIAPRTPPTTAPTGPATLPMTAPVAAPAASLEMDGIESVSDDSVRCEDDGVFSWSAIGFDF